MSAKSGNLREARGRFVPRVLTLLRLAGLAAVLAVGLSAAPVIQYQLTSLGAAGVGQTAYRYDYFVSGIDFLAKQELDIRFDPQVYLSLSNGVAPAGFDLLLFQPNVPPGEPGDYSAEAQVNRPSVTNPFSVRVVVATSIVPAGQLFYIFDNNVPGSALIGSGATTPLPIITAVPEPESVALCFGGLTAALVVATRKRRRLAAGC